MRNSENSVLCIRCIAFTVLLCVSVQSGAEEDVPLPPAPVFENEGLVFNPPGARSLGMGAAFIAIADDATAAESNPAGLAILTQPEISVNLRSKRSNVETLNSFVNLFPQQESYSVSNSGPSFVSFVQPWKSKSAAFSTYYQQAINAQRVEHFLPSFNRGLSRQEEISYRLNLELEHFGLAGAVKFGEHVSAGVSIRYSRLSYESSDQFQLFIDDNPSFPNYFILYEEFVDDVDSQVSAVLGLLFNPGDKFSFGLVYKSGSEFNLERSGNGEFFFPPTRTTLEATFPITNNERAQFVVPDSIGAGLAVRPNSNWTIGLDAIHIRYGDTNTRFGDDAGNEIEVHFGLEYGSILGSSNTPFFVRAGFYTDPDHDGTDLIDSDREYTTFGAGIFLKNKLQLDAAIAVADENTETLISMVWRL